MDLSRIGKYEIVSRIGQGAMGEVYKAHDPVLNRFVAIKTMTGVLTADDELVERFRREAQSAARLNHVNIVTVYDFGEEQGRFYMAMELLEGVDLKEVISGGGLSDLWDKLDVMEQVADGLAFAHAQGVVHRDLKPANIRLLPSGRVKIMDFGLARLNTSEMTRTGMVMGTPNYMSPEQVRGERADARSDVFSLGAVFYEVLAGRKAFQADSMHTILFKVLEEQPEPVERIVPDLPPRFVRMIERALEKDPVRRFQHAGEMRDSLRLVRDSLTAGEADATVAGREGASETMIEGSAPTIIDWAGSGRAVDGATALDVTRLDTAARPAARAAARPAATLSGRSPTYPPRRRELSRGAMLGIMAVTATLAVGVTLLWWAQRPGPEAPPPGDITSAQVGALTAQLVGNTIELARADLQNKDYRGAIAQAERALRLDPESTEARQVIDDANTQLTALEQNAAAATAAYQRGDTEAATRALGLVLAIDPRHPAATELTAALNQHFRRQAEDARRAAVQARDAAASASGQEAFAQAERARMEAETLLRKDEFAVATQRLLQARDGFERARRNAEAEARTQALAAARAASAAAAPATRGQPAAGAAPPVTLPPPGTVPPVVAEAPPAASGAEDAVVRKVIADYARAIETRDLALFRAVKPNLSADEAKRLQDSFKAIKSQKVGITIDSIQVDGSQATVRVSRQDTINGQAMRAVNQTFRLAQGGSGWTIQTIGQ